jgi:hypothetical protein
VDGAFITALHQTFLFSIPMEYITLLIPVNC